MWSSLLSTVTGLLQEEFCDEAQGFLSIRLHTGFVCIKFSPPFTGCDYVDVSRWSRHSDAFENSGGLDLAFPELLGLPKFLPGDSFDRPRLAVRLTVSLGTCYTCHPRKARAVSSPPHRDDPSSSESPTSFNPPCRYLQETSLMRLIA